MSPGAERGMPHRKITKPVQDRNRLVLQAKVVGAGAVLPALPVIFLVINVLVSLQAR